MSLSNEQIAHIVSLVQSSQNPNQAEATKRKRRKFKKSERQVSEENGMMIYKFPDGKVWKFTPKRVDAFRRMQQKKQELKKGKENVSVQSTE